MSWHTNVLVITCKNCERANLFKTRTHKGHHACWLALKIVLQSNTYYQRQVLFLLMHPIEETLTRKKNKQYTKRIKCSLGNQKKKYVVRDHDLEALIKMP